MKSIRRWCALACLLAVEIVGGGHAWAAPPVSNLRAMARSGQVFVTWDEADTPAGTTFHVYWSGAPIVDVAQATLAGHHIEPHSARDWWADPASFDTKQPPAEPVGFLITAGGSRLNPRGGLFVHTLGDGAAERLHFAVTTRNAAGQEDTTIVPGQNSLAAGVAGQPGPIEAIWQHASAEPPVGAGAGMPLWLRLHGKSGVVANMEYLAFGDARMGWRAGLPFKFSVRISADGVVVSPTDRTWINRPLSESSDNHAPAVWTFWYGYNSRIFDRSQVNQGTPVNYTERRNLAMLDFVARRYRPDRNRWYCSGSSMGGCGTISFGLRHPELFAALHAHVPIVSYTYLGTASAKRLEPTCWTGAIPAALKDDEGESLLERMNGARLVSKAQGDLPYLYMVHGRNDGSIPWPNNPPFYSALNEQRHGFAVFWDDGTHPTSGKNAPDDVKAWLERFRRFRLDESFPAFSNASTNRDPGDGRADNGDTIGWMNRGFDWRDIQDQADRYAISITADHAGIAYPLQVDVTLRRLQRFRPAPGEQIQARVGDTPPHTITADSRGRITIERLTFATPDPLKIELRRRAPNR